MKKLFERWRSRHVTHSLSGQVLYCAPGLRSSWIPYAGYDRHKAIGEERYKAELARVVGSPNFE